ncbi:MAG: DMT family transporter [Siphonobacter aquaeclarae]|nr:DMT family transporter [Siphonobacter aquaeclarae]
MKKALFQLHISILLAGFTGLFGKLISLNEILLACYRLWIAGALLALLLALQGKLRRVTPRNAARMGVTGMLLGLHWVFFYGSIKYSNVSVGVVCFSLTGFFTALLAPLLNRTRVQPSEILLSLLTLIGIALIFSFDSRYRLGITFGTISSLFGSLYMVYNERLTKEWPAETILVYALPAGGLLLTALVPLYTRFYPAAHYLPTSTDTAWLLVLCFFCTILLYRLQLQALERLSAFTVNLSLNLEPVYSVILAIWLMGEGKELGGTFYAGLALILLSVALQTFRLRPAS